MLPARNSCMPGGWLGRPAISTIRFSGACAENVMTVAPARTASQVRRRTSCEVRMVESYSSRSDLARLIVLLVHPASEQPPAQRSEPLEHVIHLAKIDHLDQVA